MKHKKPNCTAAGPGLSLSLYQLLSSVFITNMPSWWGRKSRKNKEQQHQEQPSSHGFNGEASKNDKKKGKEKILDDVPLTVVSRNSPRTSKDFGVSGSGINGSSGFDSDGEKKGHPLPRPSVSSSVSLGTDHGTGLGSASVSVSSVSSSGSLDNPHPDHHVLFGVSRPNGEAKFSPRSRSPGPGSAPSTIPSSPRRLSGIALDFPTARHDDGRNQCHPLPLPPGSPTRPSSFHTTPTESLQCLQPNWKKGRLLGRGTFGHVYVGFNNESGQMCAIKEVKVISDDPNSKESLKQLDQEMKLLSQLSHPNIVQYYGSKLAEETLCVYLEYVSGGSIHKLLQEYGPFNEPVIQNYTRQILHGLAYLHGRNTLHRDIKGANILVGTNGEVKLADFGMAKHMKSCLSVLSFKGSPYWMAPEVVMNTSGSNLAVDIWSLGCTVLEMATSKPPWSQYEGVAAIFKIGNSKDLPDIPDHLSDEAKSFIKLCLQRDPAARPTAKQLLDHRFIREQATKKVEKNNIINDGLPSPINGSHRKVVSEVHSNRTGTSTWDGDYFMKPKDTVSRALRSPRDSVKTMTSLPVSPCSSPLRKNVPANGSCFLSPPHPAYTSTGQNGYGLSNYSVSSTWPTKNYPADLCRFTPQLKVQTPGRYPETRRI